MALRIELGREPTPKEVDNYGGKSGVTAEDIRRDFDLGKEVSHILVTF